MIRITANRIGIVISLLSIAISTYSLWLSSQAEKNIATVDRGEPDIVLCEPTSLTFSLDDYESMVTLPSAGPKAAVYSCGIGECCLTAYRADYSKEISSRIRLIPSMPRYHADGNILIRKESGDFVIYRRKHPPN